jgi:isopenicillin N synthase-like dioxygenase
VLLDVPVIDIAPFREGDQKARQAVAAEVGRAINDIGFLVITGHGVDSALVKEVQRVSNAFLICPRTKSARCFVQPRT